MTTATTAQPQQHPLESVLRLVAQAEPEQWLPVPFCEANGLQVDQVRSLVEFLRLEGLVATHPGPAVSLTPFGRQVLDDPELLGRLRTGQALRPGDPGSVIREGLRRPVWPFVTRALFAANLAVFLWCLYQVWNDKATFNAYIGSGLSGGVPMDVVDKVLRPAGSVEPGDLLQGKWWRLLTATFVHGGLIHLLVNLYTLHVIGRFVEQRWGHWRFLAIYLLAGWGGSCIALANAPILTVGASGALCGLLAAEGVWVLLYGRYLPREMAAQGRFQLVVNAVMMIAIGFLPGISNWGHGGGALIGAVAALALHFQRFGGAVWVRGVAVALLPAVAAGCYGYLQYQMSHSKRWSRAVAAERRRAEAEERQREKDAEREETEAVVGLVSSVERGVNKARTRYREEVKDVMGQLPGERDPEDRDAALKVLTEEVRRLRELADRVAKAGPFADDDYEQVRQATEAYVTARAELYELAQTCLRAGVGWKAAQQKGFESRRQRLEKQRAEWERLTERLVK